MKTMRSNRRLFPEMTNLVNEQLGINEETNINTQKKIESLISLQ